MIVAARAAGCQPQEDGRSGFHPVDYVLDGGLLSTDPVFGIRAMVAIETGDSGREPLE